MSHELENALKDLSHSGTLVKDRGYRQVWRFEHGGKGHYLKFYPRSGGFWKRLFRGNPALREFVRLQWLQKAKINAPRAVAMLEGFRIDGRVGDAVILEAIEPSVQLDQYLSDLHLRGEPVPGRRELVAQIRDLVGRLAQAGLGHSDLHLGNFLLHEGRVYLLDGYAVSKGGLKLNDLLMLGDSVSAFATHTDLLRGWETLGPGGDAPLRSSSTARQWRKFIERTRGGNRYFGRLNIDGWSGTCFKSFKFPQRWSPVSGLTITGNDWLGALPALLDQIHNDQLTILKRSPSGDVLAGEVVLGGRPVQVVVKRPRRRYWYRYLNEIGRGARARRAWRKSWNMIIRGVPSAWPMLLMEKRSFGYVTDTFIVFEQVPGPTLASIDLNSLTADHRDLLFRRTGRLLRRIEILGFSHFDAKASNWIVLEDEKIGPTPILVDIDGIRRRQWLLLGLHRLLRSMKDHPQYTRADSHSLCRGYAPAAPLVEEEPDLALKPPSET